MNRKLFLLLFLAIPAFVFSQPVAVPPPDLYQCDSEVFNLTVQDAIVLGAQSPADFQVAYFTSAANAQNGANAIANPTVFVPQSNSQTVWARVTSNSDGTYDTTSFNVGWNMTPVLDPLFDVTTCYYYILPPLTTGNYYTGPSGSGDLLLPGTEINFSQEIHVYAVNGSCAAEDSFFVAVANIPPPTVSDVSVCNSYQIPIGTPYTYYVNGVFALPGTVINQTSVVTVADESSFCWPQSQYLVTIGNPVIPPFAPLQACDPDGDGLALFDLGHLKGQYQASHPGQFLTFYLTQADAENAANPLPLTFGNTATSQVIFVRSELSEGCFTVATLELQAVACGTISGMVRFDADNNGCTAADAGIPNIQVRQITGNLTSYAYTDANGHYVFDDALPGTHYVSVPTLAVQNFGTAPGSQVVTISGMDNATQDFCVTPIIPVADAAVHIFPQSSARPGFPLSYKVEVDNVGNQPASGTVTLQFDDARLDFVSSSPAETAQSTGMLTFSYNNLAPAARRTYTVNFMVAAPPVADIGNVLQFNASLAPDDADLLNNYGDFSQIVVNSMDPNSKSVSTELTAIDYDDPQNAYYPYLRYVVNFQNLGTAPAQTVRITDQLDSDLDWATFRPVAGSHPYRVSLDAAGMATFVFEDINLAAASDDEEGSKGYVVYEVKLGGNGSDNVVDNTANIYFDFNAPIVTNTVHTNFVYLSTQQHTRMDMSIYPNPATELAIIKVPDANGHIMVTLADIQGKILVQQEADANEVVLDVSGLAAGLYVVQVKSGGKSAVRKLIRR